MLHILVSIKQVPDTTNIRIDPETGSLIRTGVPAILNPYDAHAVAVAAEWKHKMGGHITTLTMGPPAAEAALQECVEMGADRGILLSDRKFAGADTLATSYVLAEAIREIHNNNPLDLILFGKQAIDGDTAQVGPGVAMRLGFPLITYVVGIREINLEEHYVIVERKTEASIEIIKSKLPAVLTAEKEIADIPYASLPDLIKSLRYQPEVWSAQEPVQFDDTRLGLKGSPTQVAKTGTPELHHPGKTINTTDKDIQEAVNEVWDEIFSSPKLALVKG
ncbi:MAG: electron transfer flavoprotein subunit beta/FixA family protein [Anaerolineales bacterium]|nr:electron transfer flavoprotein subunit beta/FixA family protein [Anaerolineales bacterium]